ncbi:hypothetical protein BLNAU_12918 [Blattamonas nauphoetae]|uniref:Uncharacterized protein n=1 Tax=Blattamonas nauphoetae TaxID=2049346 RepID=A0ABQ9XL08_9EUKA|nr:hypothetical protein BLNAU_12918 [Blattamonas nauphoetae]
MSSKPIRKKSPIPSKTVSPAAKKKARWENLMKKLKITSQTIITFSMPSVKNEDLVNIQNISNSNSANKEIQTGSHFPSVLSQTDTVSTSTREIQVPDENIAIWSDYLTVVKKQEVDSPQVNKETTAQIHPTPQSTENLPTLLRFLRKASNVMESVLNENILLVQQQQQQKEEEKKRKSKKTDESPTQNALSAANAESQAPKLFLRTVVLKWAEMTNDREITALTFAPSDTRYVYASYGPVKDESKQVQLPPPLSQQDLRNGFVFAWNLNQLTTYQTTPEKQKTGIPTRLPHRILLPPSPVSALAVSPLNPSILTAALINGGVCLWDINEPPSNHFHTTLTTYSEQDNDKEPILVQIQTQNPSYTSLWMDADAYYPSGNASIFPAGVPQSFYAFNKEGSGIQAQSMGTAPMQFWRVSEHGESDMWICMENKPETLIPPAARSRSQNKTALLREIAFRTSGRQQNEDDAGAVDSRISMFWSGSDKDPGLHGGSTVSLKTLSSLSLSATLSPSFVNSSMGNLAIDMTVTCATPNLENPNQAFVGLSSGFILRLTRAGTIDSPDYFFPPHVHSFNETPSFGSSVVSLSTSPTFPSIVLAAYSDGSNALFDTSRSPLPLTTWTQKSLSPSPTLGSFWSPWVDSQFFTILEPCMFCLWDLQNSDLAPTITENLEKSIKATSFAVPTATASGAHRISPCLAIGLANGTIRICWLNVNYLYSSRGATDNFMKTFFFDSLLPSF